MERRFNSLRSLREYKKWSMDTLAKKIGVTAPTIWKWEQQEIAEGPAWLKPKHRNLLSAAFTDEELAEAFDPDWQPSAAPEEPVEESSQPEVIVQPVIPEPTKAEVLADLMAILPKLSTKELQSLLGTAQIFVH